MTFEEWLCSYEADLDKDNEALAKDAWDYQQARINELGRMVETAYDHGYANGYTDGKQDAQEQE